mgnify:FL=1
MSRDTPHKTTVFYDGSCPLCDREINFYKNMVGGEKVNWYDLSIQAEANPTMNLTREAALKRFHLETADGTLLSGGAAFAHLWTNFPKLRLFGKLAGFKVIAPLFELAYLFFLRCRPALRLLFRQKS